MDDHQSGEPPRPGLRERKKAKTRALIQAEAVRLFLEQGYDETSIEQIAEAAEVSPSTVFRYFPSKPDLIIYDDLDERMIAAFHALPPELNAIQSLRAVFGSAFRYLGAEDLDIQRERAELVVSVPEVRASMLGELTRTVREIAELVAQRSGRQPDDDDVLALSGAVIGIAMAAWFTGGDDSEWMMHFLDRVDRGMELLETGFNF